MKKTYIIPSADMLRTLPEQMIALSLNNEIEKPAEKETEVLTRGLGWKASDWTEEEDEESNADF